MYTQAVNRFFLTGHNKVNSVTKIMNEIESLPHQEYMKLVHWFSERDWDKWDLEIEEDSKSGKLDFLFEEASQSKLNNKLKDL